MENAIGFSLAIGLRFVEDMRHILNVSERFPKYFMNALNTPNVVYFSDDLYQVAMFSLYLHTVYHSI